MATFSTSREIPATVEQVFAAISHPERLAQWWGPAGFTNTFNVCEFHSGGRWSFTMHGPDGRKYPNENVFAEIQPPTKIVVQHVSEPKYRLTIELVSSAVGTVVSWLQAFESSEVASRLEHIVVPANEQNLERLSAEVLRKPGRGPTGETQDRRELEADKPSQ
ncbi:MAG TPA: SRPBCC domain-containing protein [Pirellulales bacterium]